MPPLGPNPLHQVGHLMDLSGGKVKHFADKMQEFSIIFAIIPRVCDFGIAFCLSVGLFASKSDDFGLLVGWGSKALIFGVVFARLKGKRTFVKPA